MITKQVKLATGCLSLIVGALLAVFIPMTLVERGIDTRWVWAVFAPGWEILSPGAHDAPVALLAIVFDTALLGLIIFAIFYGFVKLVDKLTQ